MKKKFFKLGEAGIVVRLSASDSKESFPSDKYKNGESDDGGTIPPQEYNISMGVAKES